MPLFTPLEGIMIKHKYANPTIGSTITSALLSNPKTAFTPSDIIPEESASLGGKATMHFSGVWSTAASLPITLTLEMKGIAVATMVIAAGVLVTNRSWNIDVIAHILNDGNVEVQGTAIFNTGAAAGMNVEIKNTVPYTMSTVSGVPVILYATWGALALGGSIQLRQMTVEVI